MLQDLGAANRIRMYKEIQQVIDRLDLESISEPRRQELNVLVHYLQSKVDQHLLIQLNFICTHNSRRSQFSQVWAQVAADYYGVTLKSYSGGVEVTAFNERAVASLERFGFSIVKDGTENPRYAVRWSEDFDPLIMFSKLYDDVVNPFENFAAIMTCSHADENCPLVVGCEERIPIRYDDPKEYDDTPRESEMYDARSLEIATELFYVFSNVSKS